MAEASKIRKRGDIMSIKILGLAAVAALMALGGSSASATTLEKGGVTQTGAVTVEASVIGSVVLAKTDGSVSNSCTESSVKGTSSVFTGTKVTGSLSQLSFKKCTVETVVVEAAGGLYVEHESGTTSGSVFSENAKVSVPTHFGFSVTCDTGAGTKIGTVDGVASSSAHATMTVNAVLNCGFLLPSATLKGTYKVSSPTGLGIVS
jgi:hypothetical protein